MQTISMLEFRKHALEVITRVQHGERIVLTYRGQSVARLEPPIEEVAEQDSFYSLASLADDQGENLTNEDMDKILYGN